MCGRKNATILERFFLTSELDMDYFRGGGIQIKINTDDIYHLNNGKFCGTRWINVSVKEMLYFYVALLWISIEPRDIGGYTS